MEYGYREIILESDQNLELIVDLVLKQTKIEVVELVSKQLDVWRWELDRGVNNDHYYYHLCLYSGVMHMHTSTCL